MIRVAIIGRRAYRTDRHAHRIMLAMLRGESICWHPFHDRPLWRNEAMAAHKRDCLGWPLEKYRNNLVAFTHDHLADFLAHRA